MEYHYRGWTFTECCLAGLSKDYDKFMDICKFDEQGSESVMEDCIAQGQRQKHPLRPGLFETAIQSKWFTNRAQDLPVLIELYRYIFVETFETVTKLNYPGLGWGHEEAVAIADLLGGGCTPNLEELSLAYNDVGLAGCQALAKAITSKKAPKMKTLVLN